MKDYKHEGIYTTLTGFLLPHSFFFFLLPGNNLMESQHQRSGKAPSLPQHNSVSEWDETAVKSALADLKVLSNPFLRIN